MRFSVNCSGLTYVTDTADSAGVAAAAKSGAMLPSHSASAAKMVMVPRLDPAMRFMFHLACDLLHGKFDTTGENRSQSRIFLDKRNRRHFADNGEQFHSPTVTVPMRTFVLRARAAPTESRKLLAAVGQEAHTEI